VLKEHGCKATFFVIGSRVDKWPDLVERMHEEGHELGNHTMDDVASWRLSLVRPGDSWKQQLANQTVCHSSRNASGVLLQLVYHAPILLEQFLLAVPPPPFTARTFWRCPCWRWTRA